MAIISSGNEFIVFKFIESGLAALCVEVADLVCSGEAARRGVDLSSAKYQLNEISHNIVFAYEVRAS